MNWVDLSLFLLGFCVGAIGWFGVDYPMCKTCSGFGVLREIHPLHGDQTGRGTEATRRCTTCHGERWVESDPHVKWIG